MQQKANKYLPFVNPGAKFQSDSFDVHCPETLYLKHTLAMLTLILHKPRPYRLSTLQCYVSPMKLASHILNLVPISKSSGDTRQTNFNLLYFPDSKEIAFIEGLVLCCSEINQSNQPFPW